MQVHSGIVAGVLALASMVSAGCAAPDPGSGEDLITLAHQRFANVASGPETGAFEAFFRRIQTGHPVEFFLTPQSKDDPRLAGAWGKERTIKAEWIRWLCTDPKATGKVSSQGIYLIGARIEGILDLSWVNLPYPFRTYGCVFTEDIRLDGARLRSLQLGCTWIKRLTAVSSTVDNDVSLTDAFRAAGPVSFQNATINGLLDGDGGQFSKAMSEDPALNLKSAKIGSVFLRSGFMSSGEVRMRDITIGGTLDCDSGRFISSDRDWSALDLEGAKTGFVLLKNSIARGRVWLYRATINGNVECNAAWFINPNGAEALNLDYAKAGTIILHELFALGTVSLLNATIDGSLEFDGATIMLAPPPAGSGSEGVAIRAQEASIKGSVRLVNVRVDGYVNFGGSQIDHELRLEKIRWSAADLDLSFAKAKALVNAEDSWPARGTLHLEGFTFDELRPESGSEGKQDPDANTEKNWIKRQGDKPFHSQPYEQMASVFRSMGLQEEAVQVLIKKSKIAGRDAFKKDQAEFQEDWTEFQEGWTAFCKHFTSGEFKQMAHRAFTAIISCFKIGLDWLWIHVFGPLIDYGYHPGHALFASVLVIGLGGFLFRCGYRAGIVVPTNDDASWSQLCRTYPKFSACIYSLETFVPLVRLGIGDHWKPNAHPRWGRVLRYYYWFHIVAGWVLTTLWVGAFTGLIKT